MSRNASATGAYVPGMDPITYIALKPIQVGAETRARGDLVPEVHFWPSREGLLRSRQVMEFPVAALPRDTREVLEEWWLEREMKAEEKK